MKVFCLEKLYKSTTTSFGGVDGRILKLTLEKQTVFMN